MGTLSGVGQQVFILGVAIAAVGLIALLTHQVSSKKSGGSVTRNSPAAPRGAVGAGPAADQEIAAVIAATIAMFERPGARLAVRAVYRAPRQSNAWARAGREAQMNGMF